jgi:hypothetical protein
MTHWEEVKDAGYLKPCPFHTLGDLSNEIEEPRLIEEDDDRGNFSFFVHCPWCNAQGPTSSNADDAVSYLNREE